MKINKNDIFYDKDKDRLVVISHIHHTQPIKYVMFNFLSNIDNKTTVIYGCPQDIFKKKDLLK